MNYTRIPVHKTWLVLHMRSNVFQPMCALFPIGCKYKVKQSINIAKQLWFVCTSGVTERMTAETIPMKTSIIARTLTVPTTGSDAQTTGPTELTLIWMISLNLWSTFQWLDAFQSALFAMVSLTAKMGWPQMNATQHPVQGTLPVPLTSLVVKRPIFALTLIGYGFLLPSLQCYKWFNQKYVQFLWNSCATEAMTAETNQMK